MKKRLLEKAILAVLLGGTFVTCSIANAAALNITGTAGDTTASTGAKTITTASTANVVNQKPSYKKYTYSADSTLEGISLDGTNAWLVNAKGKTLTVNGVSLADGTGKAAVSVTNGGDFNFTSTTATTSNLLLKALATDGCAAYGFYLKGNEDKQALGYLPFVATSINDVNGNGGAFGLYVDNGMFVGAYGTSVKSFAIGSQNGDTVSYGVSTNASGTDKAAGVYATNNSSVLLPQYTAYVSGNGAVAESGSKIALGSDKAGSTVTIYVDKDNTDNYAALLSKGGQIDVDLQDKWTKGEISYGENPKGLATVINGNLVAVGGYDNASVINMSLTNAGSLWDGVAYNTSKNAGAELGNINLWIGNGATWINEEWGTQSGFEGSHVTNLQGGTTSNEGYIFQKDSNSLDVDSYSGNTKVFYEHNNDGSKADDYAAGDIRVKTSEPGSSLTLITDSKNISLSNTAAVENSLNALAGKLSYLGYIGGGEDNLIGYVQIAEGLTAASATMLKEGFIAFDDKTGNGSYEAMDYKDAQTKSELANIVTGVESNDKAYVRAGVLREDGKYHFDKDSTITLKGTGTEFSGVSNQDNVVIEATDKDVTLKVSGDATSLYGIKQNGTEKAITVTAKNLNVDVAGEKRTEAVNIYNTDYDNSSTMTVNGNLNIHAQAGATALMGVHTVGNSFLDVSGDLTVKNPDAKDGKWGTNAYGSNGKTIGNSYFGNAAVYVHSGMSACQKAGGVNVGGDVDIVSQAGGLYINGGGGVININGGGRIENDSTVYAPANFGDAAYAAMRAEDGYIYMNVKKDTDGAVKGNVTGVGTSDVNIFGNLSVTRGADNAKLDPNHTESIINLGLGTDKSSWKGVAYNAYSNAADDAFRGEINLWLQNGAQWTNEEYSKVEAKAYAGLNFAETGSRINKLTGGSSIDKSGVIFQNDSHPITIDEYSGNTKVVYEHANDGSDASDYAAGDITIKSAQAGSSITLVTDNTGIANVDNADKTLNALANKLNYTGYVNDENNLYGRVAIAEGLTSSSAYLKLGNMTFDEESGQGKYVREAPKEKYSAQITGDEAVDKEYVGTGVLKNNVYDFKEDTLIEVENLTGKTGLAAAAYSAKPLNIKIADGAVLDIKASGAGKLFAIDAKNGLEVDGGKLKLDLKSSGNAYGGVNMTAPNAATVANINSDLDIAVESSGTNFSGYALGMYVSKGTLNLTGDLTIKDGNKPGVKNTSGTKPDYFGWIDVYSTNGAKVNLNKVDLISGGEGLYANNNGSVINVTGGKIIHTEDDAKYYALRAAGASINVNMNEDNSEAAGNKTVIEGNITTQSDWVNKNSDASKDTVINLGLNTSDSSLKGIAYNAFGSDGIEVSGKTFKGGINMWLQEGATWTNEDKSTSGEHKGTYGGLAFAGEGSHLAKLTGGTTASKAGVIIQKDANPITIDKYSGNTKVMYEHTKDGSASEDYAGGNVNIKSAQAGSNITLVTDNSGITDVKKAGDTLNALANKLTYSASVNGENNLSGKVEIAEGLTSSSAAMRMEDISFDAETGQGYYDEPLPPYDPTKPVDPIDRSDKVLTGTMKDASFLKGRVTEADKITNYDLQNGEYTFLALNAEKNSNSVITLAPNTTMTLGGEESNGMAMIINDGANVTVNGNLNLSASSKSYGASGISMMVGGSGVGEQSHLKVNGLVTMGDPDKDVYGVTAEDKHGAYDTYMGTRWTAAGINVNQGHGSTLDITDGVTMLVDGHGIVTDPYYTDENYKDQELAVVNVNGPVNLKVAAKDGEEVGLYAFANYGGTINVGMQDGNPGEDDVKIHGNVLVMKDNYGEEKNPYFYRSGVTNLALTTPDSQWTGVVDNTGTNQAGEFNLYLKNGGTWNYQDASSTNALSASTMPQPSVNFYGNYDGISHVASLNGGLNMKKSGVIMMNSNDNIEVDKYSGKTLVMYEHDAAKPTAIHGGDLKIKTAELGSGITLSTDNVGITENNNVEVMNALAGKLYYMANDNALVGKVQIAEGLTAASATMYSGNIEFKDSNGQGYYTKKENDVVINGAIGDEAADDSYTINETATEKTYSFKESKVIEVEAGPAVISDAEKTIVIDNAEPLILSAEDEASPIIDGTKGDIDIKGVIKAEGLKNQTIANVGNYNKLNIAGAELIAEEGKVIDMGYGSVVNLGVKDNGESTRPIGRSVDVDSNISEDATKNLEATGKEVKLEGDINNNGGTLNMALATKESNWNGNYSGQAGEMNLLIDKGSSWTGSTNGDKININLKEGTWVNKGTSQSTTGNLNLQAGGVSKAFLDMSQGSGDLNIDNYSGGMTVLYDHESTTPTTINGGNVRIVSAAENSVVNMITTSAGVNTDSEKAIKDTLTSLANKLYYTNYNSEGLNSKGNITGTVGIGESLTRPTMFSYMSDLQFDKEQAGISGKIRDDKPHGEIIYGDSETGMMRGAKMAMASTAMVWRAESNDLLKRMGDLRLRKEKAGVWAKYYSGRNEYSDKGSFNNHYKAVQVGADRELGHGWLGGVALSYNDGNTTMNNGGHGDVNIYNLGVYGTKMNKNGEFIDLIAKAGRLENKYTIYNDYGYSLDGDYKNLGLSMSAEYGKKINLKKGLVLTPSAEFTVGRVGSKDYNAYSEHYKKNLHVNQDAFNSAVGRLSLGIGKETDKYSYYAKASLAHEFAGDFNTSYSAEGEPTSKTSMDFKGTWKELQVGGSVKLNNNAMLYGTFGRSFGGEVTQKWRVDAGVNITFNHLRDFFGGKAKDEQSTQAPAEAKLVNSTVAEIPAVKADTTQAATQPVAQAPAQPAASYVANEDALTVNNNVDIKAEKNFGEFVMDEYIITANRTPQRITDATADVSVVTRNEIEEKHIVTVEEALRTVPGVQFNNYGSGNQMNANISSLRINGSKDIAVLVDGVKINDFQGVGESGNMYAGVLNNINNIERIEVLRGAAGVLYGSGAKGGVINIITREVEENKTVIDTAVGSFGREDYKFNTMGKAGKLTYNLYQGTYRQGDVTDGRGDKWAGFTKTKNAGAKLTYKFTDNHKLTVDYMDIDSKFGGTDLIYSNFYKGKFESTMWSIRDDLKMGDHWSNTLVYRQNEEKRQHSQEYFAGNKLTNANNHYKYQFISDQLNYNSDRFNMTVGVDYASGKDQNNSLVNGVEAKRSMKNLSAYANGEWKLLPNLTLTAGIRHDRPESDSHGSEMANHTTKSYKLAWDITKKDTLYAGRSEYFILPSMNQLYDKKWGNAGLKPAEGRTSSIGYNKKFDDRNFLTVNYFQTKEDCGIGWDGYNRVNTNGISRGWNAQITSRISDKWDFQMGWAHLYERSGANDNYTLGYYPKDLATFGINYTCGKFSSALDGRYFIRRKDNSGFRKFPVDNYGVYNLSMNYRPTKHMNIYFKVENIFDKFYCEHTDAGSDPFLTGDGERKYYAMPGRAFMVGTQFTF